MVYTDENGNHHSQQPYAVLLVIYRVLFWLVDYRIDVVDIYRVTRLSQLARIYMAL